MKKHLKLISIVLALVMVIVAFAACGGSKGGSEDASGKAADVTGANAEAGSEAADADFKVGSFSFPLTQGKEVKPLCRKRKNHVKSRA